jgi:hypothetical protein
MAKMQIAPEDRPRVKVECLRVLATLQLDPAKTQLISGFVDTYLRLNAQEEQAFENEIDRLEENNRESVMQIVTSWMEQGKQEGREMEARALLTRQLTRQLGQLPDTVPSQLAQLPINQLEDLAEALFDFSTASDLEVWLDSHSNV